MTFLDPWTAKSVVDIVFQLEQTSRKWETKDDLQRALTALAESGLRANRSLGLDEAYAIAPIDWSMLASNAGASPSDASALDRLSKFRTDMKQSHPRTCSMNAVRFVLQKRFDVMVGQFHGDAVVHALIANEYKTFGDLERDFASDAMFRKSFDLEVVKGWLASLGIMSRDPVIRTDIAAYISEMRAQLSGMFLVAGDLGDDHTFVLYEFRTVAGQLEAKVYNPFTGMNLPQPSAGSPTDWYNVRDFQDKHGLPLLPGGQKIPNPTPGGRPFLRPLDGNLASHAPLNYSVIFVPAL